MSAEPKNNNPIMSVYRTRQERERRIAEWLKRPMPDPPPEFKGVAPVSPAAHLTEDEEGALLAGLYAKMPTQNQREFWLLDCPEANKRAYLLRWGSLRASAGGGVQ